MELGYDIFRELENGDVIWVGCCDSLSAAKSQILALLPSRPSRYFVRSANTGQIIAHFDRTSLGQACA